MAQLVVSWTSVVLSNLLQLPCLRGREAHGKCSPAWRVLLGLVVHSSRHTGQQVNKVNQEEKCSFGTYLSLFLTNKTKQKNSMSPVSPGWSGTPFPLPSLLCAVGYRLGYYAGWWRRGVMEVPIYAGASEAGLCYFASSSFSHPLSPQCYPSHWIGEKAG